MRSRKLQSTRQNRRGMILAVSLFLVSLCSVAVVLMAKTVIETGKINHRKREMFRAACIAEGGVALVQHWGNHAGDYTLDPNLFLYTPPTEGGETGTTADSSTSGGAATFSSDSPGAEARTSEGASNPIVVYEGSLKKQYPNLYNALVANGGRMAITPSMMAQLPVGRFKTSKGVGAGKIKRIDLYLPGITGAPSYPSASALSPELIVRVVGRSEDGIERTNLSFMDLNPFIQIRIPAALVSMGTAGAFGNSRIHWGEAWSKAQFDMLNRSQMDYISIGDTAYDPWAIYRTENKLKFPNNWQWKNSSPWSAPDKLYNEIGSTGISAANEPGRFPDGTGNFRKAFFQNVAPGTLEWPNFAMYYEEFKDYAIQHGRYFTTSAGGHLYNSSNQEVSFEGEFGDVNRDSLPHDFVFIDTIDKAAPNPDGSNLTTIQLSGASAAAGYKGVFYICANFDGSGTGSPPTLGVAQRPDGVNVSLQKIFLDGVMYASGTVALAGNMGAYGSVVAQRGFVGGGTPDIYYNYHLKDGLVLENGNVGSRLQTVLRTSYSVQTDEEGNPPLG